ncbi:MAG: alcohol dehydrogenase catalytic domain-containing protein, partial [Candidatus Helarchaeota archaeon]|nr:alcohol dehydrogenase catalytic domain-containing protein [Candidatus Helarchaeota archaeon]
MRAAVFEDIRKIVYRLDYPKPVVGPNDALVRVRYCGICGSDVTNYKGKLYQTPIVMGHEFVGEVVELGEILTDFKMGEMVLGINVKLDVLEGDLKGLGIFMDGGFAEYVKVPKEFLFHAPSIPLQECPLIESFAIAFRAIKLAKIDDHQNIVI